MAIHYQHRKRIHYLLITSIIFIQLIIMLFFYNEFFNERKLDAIEQQIKDSKVLKNLTADARSDLSLAQTHLQKYVSTQDKKHLEDYFNSLKNLSIHIDSIEVYGKTSSSPQTNFHQNLEGITQLNQLEKLIDSTYKASQKKLDLKDPPKIKEIEIKDRLVLPDVEVHHISDSAERKKLFPRLKDAITGKVDVKRDTTVIITHYKNTIDTAQVKLDLDSTLQAVNTHYQKEIQKFKTQISLVDTQTKNLHQVYVNLIELSNHLMGIYDKKVEEFNSELENQYIVQNSLNHKIRRYSVLGLMVLMFLVLGMLIYYTKLSFQFEKELKDANRKVEQNLNFKNRILGMLSHEVRSPLKIMNIFIQRIQQKTEDPKVQDYLKSMEFTNNSLLIQANQILDYAKNQEKPLILQPKSFALKNEIDSLLTLFKPYIESRNNQFQTEVEIAPSLVVFSDNIKIHQLFINILGNANKFTENGEIKVFCKTSEISKTQLKLNVVISDTGMGISKADIKKIFDPYYQGILSEDVHNLGAGLGLNLCKEIVQLLNGTIYVESEPQKGTKVSFEIYLDKQDANG
jgi:two-component system sensor histidine kinase BarA